MKRLVLVRHGETAWTAEGRLTSFTDVALNERGKSQSRKLGEAFREVEIATLWSSPLQRAIGTAEVILEGRDNVKLEVVDEAIELDFGPYEGLQTRRPLDERLEGWWKVDETFPPQGVEPLEVASSRICRLLTRPWNGTAILVSHGVVIRLLICQVLGLPLAGFRRIGLGSGGYAILDIETERPRLVRLSSPED